MRRGEFWFRVEGMLPSGDIGASGKVGFKKEA